MPDARGGRAFDPRAIGLFLAVAALTAYPPLAALWQRGTFGAFQYFSHDVFYYLAIADHSRAAPFFTFDGVHPTNGFHPLWLLYLHTSFAALDLDLPAQVRFTALSSIMIASLGTACFAIAAMRLTSRVWLGLLASVPGFFHLALPYFGLRFGSQWGFANGMESPLSVLFFGALSAWLFRNGRDTSPLSPAGWVVLSLALTGMTFARLDDALIFVPVGIFAATTATTTAERRATLARLCLLPTLAIGSYLLYNFYYAGTFLPSSGAAKSQPLWALLRNGYALLTTFFPFLDLLRSGPSVWHSEAWRIVQMLVPAAVGGIWLWRRGIPIGARGARMAPWRATLGSLAAFVVIKAAYNFAMVGLWHQGDWYYVVSIMATNLLIAAGLSDWLDRARAVEADAGDSGWAKALPRALPACASAALVFLLANNMVDQTARGRYQSHNHTFWAERRATRAALQQHCPGCGVLSFDDGIISYSLGDVSTLSGFGLAADHEAERARAAGHLLELAYQRGHRLITTVNYEMSEQAYSDPDRLRRELQASPQLKGETLEGWEIEVAFESPESRVRFVRFWPRGGSRAERASGGPH